MPSIVENAFTDIPRQAGKYLQIAAYVMLIYDHSMFSDLFNLNFGLELILLPQC